jgi:hypothetical protein
MDMRPILAVLRGVAQIGRSQPLPGALRGQAENLSIGLEEEMARTFACSLCDRAVPLGTLAESQQAIGHILICHGSDYQAEFTDALGDIDPLELHTGQEYDGKPVVCPLCNLRALAQVELERRYAAREGAARE